MEANRWVATLPAFRMGDPLDWPLKQLTQKTHVDREVLDLQKYPYGRLFRFVCHWKA